MKKVVLSLHGIRTRGVWQKELAPVLAKHGFIPYPLDYGNFPALFLLVPWFRQRKIEWLRREYERITGEEQMKRLSIIAHSLGTLLVAGMLQKYTSIKVDKLIFAGSIVKENFDVQSLVSTGQANLIENDTGWKDIWPKIARILIPGAGAAGTAGFSQKHPLLIERDFPLFKHSDYFHRTHFTTYWIPTLRRTVINDKDRQSLIDAMNLAAKNVSARLGIDLNCIRANIFAPDPDYPDNISIPQGLHYNMDDPKELSISMAINTGCSGKAFVERRQAIAVLRENWGEHEVADDQAIKVNPRLRWIISTPIPDPDDKWDIMGVFNVDGLDARKEKEDLEDLVEDLKFGAQAISALFRKIQYKVE